MTGVLLRRVQAACPGAQGDDDYDVIDADGLVVGRIFKSTTSPFVGTPLTNSPCRHAICYAPITGVKQTVLKVSRKGAGCGKNNW
jgi:hypothetical protein